VPFAPFFDLFVDTTEHFLVLGGTLREVHDEVSSTRGFPEPP
jgi:hypothetical protein